MKYLVVIALLGLLLFLVYRRLRPYIANARQIIEFIRKFQTGDFSGPNQTPDRERLVQCAQCRTWIPASRALSTRSNAVFCSIDCREGKARS